MSIPEVKASVEETDSTLGHVISAIERLNTALGVKAKTEEGKIKG